MKTIFRFVVLAAACCGAVVSNMASAGEFSVSPIRVELGVAVKSSVIGIKNDDRQKLNFQLQAMVWTQDTAGVDVYTPTDELIFFPKILSVEPGEEGLIRVGTKTPAVPAERTYRLFIEELPSPSKPAEGNSAQINVLIRFGAPIFISPLKPQDSLDIDTFQVEKGVVTVFARNTGNRHQVVQGVALKGSDSTKQEVYAVTLTDRYLLTGTAKSYTTVIPAEQCGRINSLTLEFKTDKSNTSRKIDISRAMCS